MYRRGEERGKKGERESTEGREERREERKERGKILKAERKGGERKGG